jgi:predicted TIM-barrel fold metal-dependent hydrolase
VWSAHELERKVVEGGFLGLKPYLEFAPPHIPSGEIKIFDFLPHHHLEVADAHGWIVILHIPRAARLQDPVNLEQMLEIEQRYPNVQVVIAHIGRAYCAEDVGNAFDQLKDTRRMSFDVSANTNGWVMEQLLRAVGPQRVVFGSDMPVVRMRMRRICEGGFYVNLVPPGLYGDVSDDPHMREASEADGAKLSFFMYEELNAIRQAVLAVGLGAGEIEDMMYNNAAKLIRKAGGQIR